VQRCPNTTTAIMKEMRAYLKKNSRIGKYLNLHPSSYRPMPSSETAAKRKQAPDALQFGRPTPKQTTSVASMLCKAPEEVDEDIHAKGPSQSTIEQCTRQYNGKQMVHQQIANLFSEFDIPFAAAHSRSFETMVQSIIQFGPGYKPPSHQDWWVPLLVGAKETTLGASGNMGDLNESDDDIW
jgi:hypothetical protein